MNKKKWVSCIFAILLFPCFTITVYANSSWHWFTKTPLTILPWAIAITLFIETVAISVVNQIKKPLKTTIVVVLANLVSFLLPYAFTGYFTNSEMPELGFFSRIDYYVSELPFYIVGIGFLVLTLVGEIPVVYILLKKNVSNRKRLLISIVTVNCVTTSAVAIIERMVCQGKW